MAKLVTKITGAALVGMTMTKAATPFTLSKKLTIGENFSGGRLLLLLIC